MSQNIKETLENSESTNFMEENQDSHQIGQDPQHSHSLHDDREPVAECGEEASAQDALMTYENADLKTMQQPESQPVEGAVDEKKKNTKNKEIPTSKKYENLLNTLENEPVIDNKLQLVIDFMEEALSQSGTPLFKNFWDARKLCVNFFRENISPGVRAHLWSKYGELTKQARALKEILDEQTSFAVEQIEIAINALESDIEKLSRTAAADTGLEPALFPHYLREKIEYYQQLQAELVHLNVTASRVNSLRKELIKTEMRIKQKNKFFQRLSGIGDKVFPRRKDLIKEVSQKFQQDVESFIKEHFSEEEGHDSLFALRDEIKKFQSIAKILTLNTQSFTSTRLNLSKCWDKVKVEEKERKKNRAEKRAVSKENASEIFALISALKNEIEAQAVSVDEALNRINEISSKSRETELARDEVLDIRDSLNELRKILSTRAQQEEEARHQKVHEKQEQRRQQYAELKNKLESLVKEHENLKIEQIVEGLQTCKGVVKDLNLNKVQRMELDPLFRSINDLLSDKREASILNLSEGDRGQLQELEQLLQQRIERRREIKEQLEILRKSAGGSGLDFEQGMKYNQLIETEKSRMEKTIQAIQEIEEKIAQLKNK